MRRALAALALVGALVAPASVMAQSPTPDQDHVVQTICLSLDGALGLDAAKLTEGIQDGSVTLLAIVECPSAAESPAPSMTPEPDVPTRPISYKKVSDRTWSKIIKSPDKYLSDALQVWACITQFDAATGTDTFRAQALNKRTEYWYSDGDNALFVGDETKLEDFVEDDIVSMNVLGSGSLDYDTQAGGNTTVPVFLVQSIKRRGSCA